jgi:hypothetical protein
VEIAEIGGGLLHEHRIGRADPAQLVEHLPRNGQAGRLADGGCLWQGGHPVRQRGLQRLAAGALGHQRQQLLDGQDRVAEDAVPDRGAGGLGGIIGDLPQPQAVRQVIAGDVRVVAEDGRADDNGQVVSVQMPGQRPDRERQAALVQRMILGERRPLGGWRRPHRGVHLLGQGDRLIPARSPGHGRAEDQDRPLRGGDRAGQPGRAGSGPVRADALRTTAGPRAGASQSSRGSDRNTGPAGGWIAVA